jgi:DNA (cytosine-5)-methyltransferase 1
MLTAVSLFSGCGGFDWGASRAGVKIIWANDKDFYAAAAYRSLFPNVDFYEGDIRNVKKFPKADILIGCYPCTGFSEAAKRRAEDMKERRNLKECAGNYLYREFLRALRQVQPKFLFVENVRGMLTASDGWFLERQLVNYRRHGYRMKKEILLANDFGVAQERRRVFLVGVHQSVKDFEYEFPKSTHGPGREHPWRTLRDVLGKMVKKPDDDYLRKQFHGHYLTRNRKRGWDEISYTIVAHGSHVPLHPSGKCMVRLGKDHYELRGSMNRRLTWRECATIQDLPAKIKVPGGLMAKYRVVGNAVPPALARALIRPVLDYATKNKSIQTRSSQKS